MAKKPTSPDWEQIEADYRAGQLSVRAIGSKHGVGESTIRKRADKNLWERDLTKKVQQRVRSELVRSESAQVRSKGAQSEVRTEDASYTAEDTGGTPEEQIIAAAAATGVEVVLSHRVAISGYRFINRTYADLLSDQVQKGTRTVLIKGDPVEVDVDLEYVGKCLGYGTGSLQKLTQMERQAFSLDEKDDGGGDKELESVMDLVFGQNDGLMPTDG